MPGKREIITEKSAGSSLAWLIPTVAASALAAGYAGFCIASAASGSINPNTTIGGQDVGGLTRTEAVEVLRPTLSSFGAHSGVHMTLDRDQEIAFLTYDELGVTFNAETLAREAYESSHGGNVFAGGWDLLCAVFGKQTTVTPEPESGWEAKAAERLAAAGELEAADFSYEVGDSSLTMTKARNGRSVDKAALEARLGESEADESGARTVDLPYSVLHAEQGDLNALNTALGGEMANARYDAENNVIIPERPALHFDVAQAQMLLDAAAPGAQITVSAETEAPTVTAAELEKVLFRDILGTYTTSVSGAAGRKSNVRLTAERVNGCVLNSGEEFNYYDLCGPFSKANGYQAAPGYLHGKTVDMDGGGACQCSSTVYAAALTANLEIVKRTAHGFASSYIGLGLDATVSGGGPEFIFRNNTDYPIKVEAIYSADNHLTVNIRGTKTDDTKVKMRSVVISTTPFAEQVVVKEDMEPGSRVVDQTPYTGYVVDTYRDLYDGNGKLISSTFEARSRYNKRDRIVFVGPDAPAADPAAESAPGSETGGAGAETPAPAPVPAPAPAPAPEPAPEPSDIPGGVNPTPIDEQINNLAQTEETGGEGV